MVIMSGSARRDWREEVSEPDARKVFEALADPKWDFRTIDGLGQSTGLTDDRIAQILLRHRSLIRQSPVLDRRGRALYTLSSKGATFRELLTNARAFISKSTSTE